jgi:hypothetical protein
MKNKIACLSAYLFISGVSTAQQFKGEVDAALLPKPSAHHYESEYTSDKPVDANLWLKEKPGLNVSFASEDEFYFRAEVPVTKNETLWQAAGWKGERLNTQLVIWSPDTLQQIRFKLSDLKNESGKVLTKDNIQLNKVCYVLSNYPYGSSKPDCGESPYKNGFLMPDRFAPIAIGIDRFDVPGKTTRPVWLSVNIPATAEAGTYTGFIDVISQKDHAVLNIKVKVQNEILPKPHDWHYRLDLWQNPWAVADYYHVKPWSDEHKRLLKKHLQLYANAGGTFITTYGVHSPWGDEEYSIEGAMIEWIKCKNGSWKFDYTIFDEYVELAMSVGIDKAITVYTPLPYNDRFRYMDETTGNYVYENWSSETETFKINWNSFLNDLKTHLQKKRMV